jgi:hypothetical protein
MGYHLDMLVVGLMTGLLSVMGLPCVWSSHSKDAFECHLLLLVCRKDARMGYHLDMLVVGLMTGLP